MATAFVFTPCKDKKYEKCANYKITCDKCTHKHGYTILLANHKDYYKEK